MSNTPKPHPVFPALTLRSVRTIAVEVPLRYVLGTSAATVRAAPLLLVDSLQLCRCGQGCRARPVAHHRLA